MNARAEYERWLDKLPVAQTRVCDVAAIDSEVTRLF